MTSVLEADTKCTFFPTPCGNSSRKLLGWNCQINTGKVNSLTIYFSVLFKVVFFFFRQWGPWLDDTVGPGSLLRSTHLQGFFLCPSTPTWPWPKMASPLGTTWHTRKSARVSLECRCFLRQHDKRINALTSSLSQLFTVAIPSAWSRERSQMTRSQLRPVSTMNGGCRDKPAWISTTTDGRPTKTATENTYRWSYSFIKCHKTGLPQNLLVTFYCCLGLIWKSLTKIMGENKSVRHKMMSVISNVM